MGMRIALIVDTTVVCEMEDDDINELFTEYVKQHYPEIECDVDELVVVPMDL